MTIDIVIVVLIVAVCCIFIGLKAVQSLRGKGNGCGCGCSGGCSPESYQSTTQSNVQTHIGCMSGKKDSGETTDEKN